MLHKRTILVSAELKEELRNLAHNSDSSMAEFSRVEIRKALCEIKPRGYQMEDGRIEVSGISDSLKIKIEEIARDVRISQSAVMKIFLYIAMDKHPDYRKTQRF